MARTNKQMTKRTMILEAAHKTARGLRKVGVMSAQTMREFDVLCLPKRIIGSSLGHGR